MCFGGGKWGANPRRWAFSGFKSEQSDRDTFTAKESSGCAREPDIPGGREQVSGSKRTPSQHWYPRCGFSKSSLLQRCGEPSLGGNRVSITAALESVVGCGEVK
jgi:hypothetical protein